MRLYHTAVARECIAHLAGTRGSLRAVAAEVAARTGQSAPTVDRRLHRIRQAIAPSEDFLDVLRTMTGRLAPYQLPAKEVS